MAIPLPKDVFNADKAGGKAVEVLDRLEKMQLARRLGKMLLLAAAIAGGLIVFFWSQTPGYVPLYAGLDAKATAEATDLLRTAQIPFRIDQATGAISVLLTIVGKRFVDRVRPPRVDAVPPFELSESFPSGHTLNAVAIVGVIAYLVILRRSSARARIAIALVAAVYVVLIGFTRVFLGHHWFTDVLAGLVLGAAWLALVITAHRFYLTARARSEPVRT